MIDLTILAAVFIVLITVCIVYYIRPTSGLKVSESSKPRSKEELLNARVKHFQPVTDVQQKAELQKAAEREVEGADNGDNVCSGNKKVYKRETKEELLNTRVAYFQGITTKDVETEHEHLQDLEGVPNDEGASNDTAERDTSDENTRLKKKTNTVYLTSSAILSNTTQPECKPLKSLQELLDWIPGYAEFSIGRVLKRPVTSADRSKPKTMICHDMKGGYIEDRFVQGCNSHECFRFNQWSMIDSFCYFSHSFVTIPPPCWTNAAHNNGVKMLGTVITEWDDGAAICAEIFQSVEHVDNVVTRLVEIAKYYQFDGWLINIENPIDPSKVDNIRHFLAKLTELMHKEISESEVIWYDSVTRNGELKWQNKLCNENRMFFDACDGIFLNYNWSVSDLQLSFHLSGPHRQHDVFVGVDVFGRGCFGGGGWNTYKAMNVIREEKLSAAIFAPGWVMETLPVDEFLGNNEKFWNLIRGDLHGHCISTLPLVSTFCEGYGKKIFICGQEMSSQSWTNLSATSVLPSFSNNFYQLGPHEGMKITSSGFSTDVGFNGGGCYVISGAFAPPRSEQTKSVFRFFETRISLKPLTEYFVSYTFQCSSDQLQVFLLLLFDDRPNYLLFKPPQGPVSSTEYTVPATQEGNYTEIFPTEDDCISCHSEFATSQDWKTRNYKFTLDKQRGLLKEIRFACTTRCVNGENDVQVGGESCSFTVRVGEIRVHKFSDLSVKIPTACNLKCRDVNVRSDGEKKRVSFVLSWETLMCQGYVLPKCFDIFCSGVCDQDVSCSSANGCIETRNKEEYGLYIGRAYSDSFYVSDLIVSSECGGGVVIVVQGISYSEVRQSYDDSGKITLKW